MEAKALTTRPHTQTHKTVTFLYYRDSPEKETIIEVEIDRDNRGAAEESVCNDGKEDNLIKRLNETVDDAVITRSRRATAGLNMSKLGK